MLRSFYNNVPKIRAHRSAGIIKNRTSSTLFQKKGSTDFRNTYTGMLYMPEH